MPDKITQKEKKKSLGLNNTLSEFECANFKAPYHKVFLKLKIVNLKIKTFKFEYRLFFKYIASFARDYVAQSVKDKTQVKSQSFFLSPSLLKIFSAFF